MLESETITIAATADLHLKTEDKYQPWPLSFYEQLIAEMSQKADALIICGDITGDGSEQAVKKSLQVLKNASKKVFIVLGNHDHGKLPIKEILESKAGVTVLSGTVETISKGSRSVGITGVEGWYDGKFGHSTKMEKKIALATIRLEEQLRKLKKALTQLQGQDNIVLTHFAPIQETIVGESPEDYYFLGSPRLGEEIDRFKDKVKLILHGHAHKGTYEGKTREGLPVFNVALPVLARQSGVPRDEIQVSHLYRLFRL